MKKNLFVWAAGLMALAACSNNDELLNNENLGGKVTVTATVPGGASGSRVTLTEDNETTPEQPTIKVEWETEESFSVIRGTDNVTYSKNVEGNIFTGEAHTATEGDYYAFYPTTDATATDALPYDLSTQTGALDEAKTYMYAKSENGEKYEFHHLTALVKFTLTLPEGATNVTPTKVVIGSEKLQPVGTVNLTDDEVAYTPTENTATSITVTSTSLTFYAYVNPMTVSGDEKNTFVVSMDGSDGNFYSGTLETSVSIQTGYLYAASVSMIKVEKGDFAMADGSFIKYDANAALTDEQKVEVAGIVFWTTADMNTAEGAQTPAQLTDDQIMATDFPHCTHGLIVSLKDVSTGTKWQETYSNIASWQTSTFNADNKSDYKSIASSIGAVDLINDILGYQNTMILKAYNASLSDADAGKKVLPVSSLESWEVTNPAPANTTGWFIPSVKELHMLCYKDVDDVWEASGRDKVDTKNAVNASLEKVDGTQFDNNYYWSSSERADYEGNAFALRFDGADVGRSDKDYLPYYVRAVCAY